jgi:HSP20 family molecular chaperone IbpA
MRLGVLPLLLMALVGTARGTEPAPAPDQDELRAVIVEEDGNTVEVWIDLPSNVDPGSVEVQLAGSVVAVNARDDAGRTRRSAPLRLREPVIEDGSAARLEGTWLVVELRKDTGTPSL